MDLDTMDSADLAKLSNDVIQSYAARNEVIEECRDTRSGKFPIYIPKAWDAGIKPQHSNLGKSIPIMSVGLISNNKPTWNRARPDNHVVAVANADNVERYLQAAFARENGKGKIRRSSWYWVGDQMVNMGGCCIGTFFGTDTYAAQPAFTDAERKIRKAFWRDSTGTLTEDFNKVDDFAASKAYIKAVDEFRRRGASPIVRRYVPFDQSYPVDVGDSCLGMVIRRKTSAFELSVLGFDAGDSLNLDASKEITEVWTPRRCRMFQGSDELEHEVYGKEGIVHNYGYIPFAYQAGLAAGECEGEWGTWGAPVLSIVGNNIRNIDTVMTARANAAYQAAYPTPVAEDTVPLDAVTMAGGDGGIQHLEIKSGMINYWRGKRITYLNNPGLGKDFEVMIREEREEVRRMLPDALWGMVASSGYNTALGIQQGIGFFGEIMEGTELLYTNQSAQELELIDRFWQGPIYLDYAYRNNNFGAGKMRVRQLELNADMIQHYYAVSVEISRVVDQITLSSHMAQMQAQGLASVDEVLESRGVTDTEAMKQQILVDQFRNSDAVKQQLTMDAIKDAGLGALQAEAAAEAALTQLPDGSQGITMPDGSVAAPGIPSSPPQLPQNQGPVGAMLGGANLNSAGPNPASTNNPTQLLPTKEQPNRFRRKGGAIPGSAQKQGLKKTVQ